MRFYTYCWYRAAECLAFEQKPRGRWICFK